MKSPAAPASPRHAVWRSAAFTRYHAPSVRGRLLGLLACAIASAQANQPGAPAAAPQQQAPVRHARDHGALRDRHVPRGRFARLGRLQKLARQHVTDAVFAKGHRDGGPPLRRRVHGPLLQVLLAPGAESLEAGLGERVPLDPKHPHGPFLEPRTLAGQADNLTPGPDLADLTKSQVRTWISGEHRLRSEDRSGAGDRRAMAQDCAR